MNKKTHKKNKLILHYTKPCHYFLRSKVLPKFITKCVYKLRNRDVVLLIPRHEITDKQDIEEMIHDGNPKHDKQTVDSSIIHEISELNKKSDWDIVNRYDYTTKEDHIIVLEDSSISCKSLSSKYDEITNDDLSTIDCTNVNETQSDKNDMLPQEVILSVEGSNKVFQCMIV